jgi:hypothetical protein
MDEADGGKWNKNLRKWSKKITETNYVNIPEDLTGPNKYLQVMIKKFN